MLAGAQSMAIVENFPLRKTAGLLLQTGKKITFTLIYQLTRNKLMDTLFHSSSKGLGGRGGGGGVGQTNKTQQISL